MTAERRMKKNRLLSILLARFASAGLAPVIIVAPLPFVAQ
jgi:hypothetical protein